MTTFKVNRLDDIWPNLHMIFGWRTGALGDTLSVYLSVCPAQTCLEHSIFIYRILQDVIQDGLQNDFKMTSLSVG